MSQGGGGSQSPGDLGRAEDPVFPKASHAHAVPQRFCARAAEVAMANSKNAYQNAGESETGQGRT